MFGGNIDRNTPVYHSLHSPVQAKYLRFHPKTWTSHISMRAEVYGCQEGKYGQCITYKQVKYDELFKGSKDVLASVAIYFGR